MSLNDSWRNESWLNEDSRTFLSRGYLREGESVEDRISTIASTAEKILEKPGFADKLYDYVIKGWFSLSSPIWSNFGTDRGLPISCNGCYIPDTIEGILDKTSEIGMQTKMGAGTSAYFGDIRPRGSSISVGGYADGPVHFMELAEGMVNIISQSNIRRGSCAAYLPVDHPDIEEFLDLREEGKSIQSLSLGVCISDEWMEAMISGDKDKQGVWRKIIAKRFKSGYPYIFFTDNVNNNAPDVYKDKGRKIYASNLCSEIGLSANEDETFVCNLSSMNLLHYDEWKDTDAVETLTYFLDAVMSEYIHKTSGMKHMESANRFARNQRAIGIGTLGWHSYLQSNMVSFESLEAKLLNTEIHKTISEQSLEASKKMAKEYGEPELLEGYGRRHVTLMAIAPTTSSSFILGQISPSVEPLNSNYFVKDLGKGKFTYRNPYLEELLESKGENTQEVWEGILIRGGSVQHLDFLDEQEKDVFKTFGEISQKEVVIQAASRQKYIDQSQSLNLMVHPDVSLKEVNSLMIEAWQMGLKTLYYQRSTNPAQEYARSLLTCVSCEA